MLGLYLYTLIIRHKSCSMLSILNKLKLQKELQNLVTNNVFWQKVKNNNNENPCQSRELNPGPLTKKRMRYHCTTKTTERIDCCQAI